MSFAGSSVFLLTHKASVFVKGRGRGEGGFYQRSIEEAEGGFGRSVREIHRSQSWDDR